VWVLIRTIKVGGAVVAACILMAFFVRPGWRLLRWSSSLGWLARARWLGQSVSFTSAGGQLDLDALGLTRNWGRIDVVLAVSSLSPEVLELA